MIWPRLSKLAKDISGRHIRSVDLIRQALDEIAKNKSYNAILAINQHAVQLAESVDKKIGRGKKVGRLAGIPFIAKDNFLTKGVETTAASRILEGYIPPYDATAISRLQQEGAIMLAKANMDSFAHGASTENSDYGPTLNPHDKTCVPGGSSGGSATAVALGIVPFTLGTDTGGSIRLPASFTGTVGYKPTYGLVSRYGVIAMASSTDVIGPIASAVEDCALVLDIMASKDRFDSTTIDRDSSGYDTIQADIKGKRFGLIEEHMQDDVQPEVRQAVATMAERIELAGGIVKPISLKNINSALPVYYIVVPAEISSNLSRYDGIRYGFSQQESTDLDKLYSSTRSQGFSKEVKRRIMIGTYVLSSGYYDAFYKKAQSVRTLLIKEFDQAFDQVDFLLGPTSPTVAFKLGQNVTDPLKMYLADIMTVATNLAGLPAISLPIAKHGKLPIGIQIMAAQRHDRELLQAAHAVESIARYESC